MAHRPPVRRLSTGFEPCYRCGQKHIHALLTWSNMFYNCSQPRQWYTATVICKCGLRFKKEKCIHGDPNWGKAMKLFKETRASWNKFRKEQG